MKKKLYGLLFIFTAVFILLLNTGLNIGFVKDLSVVKIISSLLLFTVFISMIIDRDWEMLPIPLAAIFIILKKDIAGWTGKEEIGNVSIWIVILCTVIMSIGIGMVIPSKAKIHSKSSKKNSSEFHGEGNEHYASMRSETKYIDCTKFAQYKYYLRMGNGEVYFENTDSYSGGGVLELYCRLGNIDVYIPSNWAIETDIKTHLGSAEIPQVIDPNGPKLKIIGEIHIGSINIHYK